jgi:undecaprenyl-diphosphatase
LSYGEALLLGIIQGLTEFLPVSSSGHLVIAQSFIRGFNQPGVLFDVVLHFGTLLAVIFFFRKDIRDILLSLLPAKWNVRRGGDHGRFSVSTGRKTALYIVIGTVFTGIIGFPLKDEIHRLFESAEIAAAMLIVTGLLLFFSDRTKNAARKEGDMNIVDSAMIGIVQGISLIPGISRSGSTIACGIFRKLNGETAARFSFLLSIPAILGATIMEAGCVGSISRNEIFVYTAGMIVSAVTGFLMLKLLFFVIRKRRLSIFAYYCWTVGVLTLAAKTF